AMAAVIGKCLLDSGAADRLVRSTVKALGEKRAPLGFVGSSFMLGIPVFFDTVLYLMIPLAKAMATRTGRHYALFVMSIIAGGTMAHSLVPPTPGPLLVASKLNVEIGHMMLCGLVVGLSAALAGYAYARWANLRWPIPLRDSPDAPVNALQEMARKPDAELPPLWLSWLPVLLPVVLIGGDSILRAVLRDSAEQAAWQQWLVGAFGFFGDKNLALILAAGVALLLLVRQQGGNLKAASGAVQSALASGGVIILITSAGGAFGGVLQQTGIGPRIEELAGLVKLGALPLAFLVTAVVRTAQGSATVAMITAVGILEGFGDPAQLGFHPVYLAAAIGCGSKPFPWMNDSGFWIVSRMSGFTEGETIRTFSFMLTLMGVVGLLVTMLLAKLLPLV
ncbi:MAG TPA: gluconate transporter, partial [Verrucomicrobiales bacterium]|nr:gluconate transporter [Verrucomicrobiales bacterium]